MNLTPVLRIDLGSISDFQTQVALRGKPVVMGGDTRRSATGTTWTLAELATRFGGVKVPLREYDDEYKEFFGNTGGLRPRKMMSLADYIQLIENSESRNDHLPYAGNISILSDPAVAGKFASLLAESRFPDWLPGTSRDEYRLWIGAAGQRSTIHNDPYHNFNAQIVGAKRFLLFAPEQHDALYPEFFHASMWVSPIDPDAPDLARYPKFADVQGHECELREGEILFIPRFWWHCVQARKVSVNVNRWVSFDNERWHQQPEARRFVSYRKLLAQAKGQFDSLPSFLQEFKRKEFEELSAELEALIAGELDSYHEKPVPAQA